MKPDRGRSGDLLATLMRHRGDPILRQHVALAWRCDQLRESRICVNTPPSIVAQLESVHREAIKLIRNRATELERRAAESPRRRVIRKALQTARQTHRAPCTSRLPTTPKRTGNPQRTAPRPRARRSRRCIRSVARSGSRGDPDPGEPEPRRGDHINALALELRPRQGSL